MLLLEDEEQPRPGWVITELMPGTEVAGRWGVAKIRFTTFMTTKFYVLNEIFFLQNIFIFPKIFLVYRINLKQFV